MNTLDPFMPAGREATDDDATKTMRRSDFVVKKNNSNYTAFTTRDQRAEARTDQANARTEQAEARTKEANTRTAQAEGRTEQAEARTEQAEARTEKANTRTEAAETRTEKAEARSEEAETTGRNRAEEQLRVLNARLEQHVHEQDAELQAVRAELQTAHAELDAFSHSVSHDLRAPLRHVLGFVDLLQKDAGPSLSPESNSLLTTISRAALQMGDLIEGLLAFAHIGRAVLHKTEVNLAVLVKEIAAGFQAGLEKRTIAWEIGPLPEVRADRVLLRQALVNLISNAVKFTGGRAEGKIEIGCIPGGENETVIFIRDNGAGFDPRYAHKLFGVFQRLHGQDKFPGTGIGLANAQRILHRHGGSIRAEGTVDAGATFFISIPKPGADGGNGAAPVINKNPGE